jgi:hypothetical protein
VTEHNRQDHDSDDDEAEDVEPDVFHRIPTITSGIRQDAWANANRIPVEVKEPAEDRGR